VKRVEYLILCPRFPLLGFPLTAAVAEAIRFEAFTVWEKPGICSQLLDTATSRLAMSFVTEHDDQSLHVLNVVSPAFTCAPPFAEHVCDKRVAYSPSPTVR
jgi:L-2-hydroxyglutarate oxidase